MTKAGFTISGDNHPISPGLFKTFCICVRYFWSYVPYAQIENKYSWFFLIVMLGDAKLAADFADDMLGNIKYLQ